MGFIVKREEGDEPNVLENVHYYDPDYLNKYLGYGMVGRNAIFDRETGGEPIPGGSSLEVVYRENFVYDGSKVNRSLHTLTGGKSVINWRGNVLVLKRPYGKEDGLPSDTVVNIEDEDVEYLVNYLMGF